MTAATRPGPEASLRPLPWRRMAWVTWRQHRLGLGTVVGVFAALALYLLLTGLSIHHAYASVTTCRPVGSTACEQVAQNFLSTHVHNLLVTAGLLQVIPGLVGAFAGAPVLAREFETGTFRYAWTQGFGRTRWTIAKLVPLALAVTIAAAAFGVAFSWYYQPIIGAGGGDSPPLAATIFDLRGIVLPAWTLAAFAIGVVAGTLIRRLIPALFITLVVWAALAFATGAFLRPHYESPVVTTNLDIPSRALVLSQGLFRDGGPATIAMVNRTLAPVDVHATTTEVFSPGPGTPPDFGDPVEYLARHGYTQVTEYQPADRFWTFQSIEAGWLLVLSVGLMATTVWLVRRRAS